MARRISPTKVGAFVLGAVLLVVVAVVALGGGDLFKVKDRCVIYFDGSVKGLYVGSAVIFRGVEVGRVASISVRYDIEQNTSEVPVLVDLEPGRVTGLSKAKMDRETMLQTMIGNGLRAQLIPDSLVASTEVIQLDFYPGTKPVMHPNSEPYTQIPAVPSTLQQIQSEIAVAVQHLPALADTMNKTIGNFNELLSPENRRHVGDILASADTISATLAAHQAQLGDAIANLDQTSQNLAGISTNLNQILAKDRAPLEAAIVNINATALSAHQLADQLNGMLAEDRAGLKQFSNGTLPQLSGLITDARRAVHRTDDTLDELDRNPSSFLFSKKTDGIPAK